MGYPPNILRPTQEQIVWSERESELLESASERIEQYRKDDASVLVVDAAGIPVANAVVHMDMLKHDFLFGANLYILYGLPPPIEQDYTPALRQAYGDAFAQIFNYAILPFYWPSYEQMQGQEQQGQLREMALWANDRGIITKGHPLIWPEMGAPSWAEQFSPKQLDEVEERKLIQLRTKITRIQAGYEEGIYEATEAKKRIKACQEAIVVAEKEIARRHEAGSSEKNYSGIACLRQKLELIRHANLESASFEEKIQVIGLLGIKVYPSEDLKTVRIASRIGVNTDSVNDDEKHCGKVLFAPTERIRTPSFIDGF